MGFSIYDSAKQQIVGFGKDVDECLKMVHNYIKGQLNTDITMEHPSEYNYDIGYYLYYIDGKITLINILTQITNNIWRFSESTSAKCMKSWELLENAPPEEQLDYVKDVQPQQSEELKPEIQKTEEPSSSIWSWLF